MPDRKKKSSTTGMIGAVATLDNSDFYLVKNGISERP